MKQADLLRKGLVEEADLPHIAEELADLGRSEYRKLRSYLARVIQHLLKWDHQEQLRSVSWKTSVNTHRLHVQQRLAENPSLRSKLDDIVPEAYELAVARAMDETGLPRDAFPATCPYDFETIMTRSIR